jgi:hypothetical protein
MNVYALGCPCHGGSWLFFAPSACVSRRLPFGPLALDRLLGLRISRRCT